MRKALFAVVVSLTSCIPGHAVEWPKVVQCVPSASDLLNTVSSILLKDGSAPDSISDRARSELETLAQTHGPQTIACIIEQLIRSWTHPGARLAPYTRDAAHRGRAFLKLVGTDVTFTEAP